MKTLINADTCRLKSNQNVLMPRIFVSHRVIITSIHSLWAQFTTFHLLCYSPITAAFSPLVFVVVRSNCEAFGDNTPSK